MNNNTLRAALAALLCLGLAGCDLGSLRVNAPTTTDTPDMQVTPDMQDPPVVEPPRGPMLGLTPVRLLTRYEYDNTVRDLLGVDIQAAQAFPSENLTNGFENNAWAHNISSTLLRAHLNGAEAVSESAVADHRDRLLTCDPANPADQEAACVETSLRTLLPRAFRRPVKEEEVQILLSQYTTARTTMDLDRALKVLVRAILMSPQFLYRAELVEATQAEEPAQVEADPMPGSMEPKTYELLGPYEVASRLSYFLWGSMPDDALYEAARKDELRTEAQIAAQVDRMLADPRARAQVRQFHRQWFGLDRLDSVIKDTTVFPAYTQDINQDWRASFNAFLDHVYWEEGTFKAFMTSPALFLTPDLARVYHVDVPEGAEGIFRHDAPMERAGILTQPALMAILAYPNQGSPIARGIFVRERIMCEHLPSPPNNLQIEPPDPDPNATTREVFRIHTEQEPCASCHLRIDPLGLGFENFDAMGQYRTREHGLMVDASGEIFLSHDPSLHQKFNGARELAQLFSESDHIQSCVTEQWFQFAMGRPHDDSDVESLTDIKAKFKESGRFNALLKAIATSAPFRYRRKHETLEQDAANNMANTDTTNMTNTSTNGGQ